ncbi:hypothetical protein PQI65_15215 [Brachybacterium paraconglomeratum]
MNRALIRAAVPTMFIALLAACGSTTEATTAEPAAAVTPATPPLQLAAEQCELPESAIGDEGATLILDGAGDDDRKLVGGTVTTVGEKLAIEDIGCVLGGIDTPDSIVAMMEGTRAMDGRQTQTADGYSYTWSYHPDNGLDIVITEA